MIDVRLSDRSQIQLAAEVIKEALIRSGIQAEVIQNSQDATPEPAESA